MKQTNKTEVTKELLVQIKKIVTNKETAVSEKIRQLHLIGVSNSDIKNILGIRYQFVYQVIKNMQRTKDTSKEKVDWKKLLDDVK